MAQWNKDILNKFIAPNVTEFRSAEIPDLENEFPQASYWLQNHCLNNALRASFKEKWRQVVLGYIRRTHNAFIEYHCARALTLQYLNGNDPLNPKVQKYYDSVTRWENFTLQMSMAMDLFKWLNQGDGAFTKNDGSKEQRLYTIANIVKHTASAINSGQCTDLDTLPLWLSNEGILSFEVSVTFSEAAEVLSDMSKLANDYQDPRSLKEKLAQP